MKTTSCLKMWRQEPWAHRQLMPLSGTAQSYDKGSTSAFWSLLSLQTFSRMMFFKGAATAWHGGTHLLLPALGRQRQEDLWEFQTSLD